MGAGSPHPLLMSYSLTTLSVVLLSSLLGCSGEGEAPTKATYVIEYSPAPTLVTKTKTVAPVFTLSPLERAVWQVESGQRTGAILGDNGNALGPLQIWRACHTDATQFDPSLGGRYEDVADLEYAVRVFRAYTARYATPSRIGDMPFNEAAARIWNGGPRGHRKTATVNYNQRVVAAMENN